MEVNILHIQAFIRENKCTSIRSYSETQAERKFKTMDCVKTFLLILNIINKFGMFELNPICKLSNSSLNIAKSKHVFNLTSNVKET